MGKQAFDVDSLAAFLHMRPTHVRRLASRGKLPGRKVAGRWRFPRAEIHHWLEQQIELSDDKQLVQLEEILRRSARSSADAPIVLGELLSIDAVAVPLDARTRGSVIAEMTRLAAQTGFLWDASKMARAVRVREDLHPTALDNGVALLHPRHPMPSILGAPLLALGITSQGIPFGGTGGILTDVFFLICSEEDRGHLRVLARLSRVITAAGFLPAVRQAGSSHAAHALVAEYDEKLDQ